MAERVVLVTGAARGLGRAVATAFVRAGAAVVATDVDAAALEAALAELNCTPGARVDAVTCDIRDPEQCAVAVHFAGRRFGDPTILVNNAGLGPNHVWRSPASLSGRFWEADPVRWIDTLTTNTAGTYAMSRAAVPGMVAAGWGRVLTITTSLNTMLAPEISAYGVSKVALEAQAIVWARELDGTGVTVNTVCPGGQVDTDFVSADTRAAADAGTVRLLPPDILSAPLLWLATNAADDLSGCRFVAKNWPSDQEGRAAALAAREGSVVRLS
jgi:3-oxoacyl-[acyl-carrier protein] reductase